MKNILILTVIACLFPIIVNAQLYKWKDKNGATHYSNVPQSNEEIEPEVVDGEIKHSKEYYQQYEQKQEQIKEQQRMEKEYRKQAMQEYEQQRKIEAEIAKRKNNLYKLEAERAERNTIISILGTPDQFGITDVNVHTSGGNGIFVRSTTRTKEELWYKNFLGDGKMLIIKLRNGRFSDYEFQ